MKETQLSTKGQVVLPKEIREAHCWGPGTKFVVEEIEGGVALRVKKRATGRLEDVAGMLKRGGKALSVGQMDQGIRDEVRRRHGGGRY